MELSKPLLSPLMNLFVEIEHMDPQAFLPSREPKPEDKPNVVGTLEINERKLYSWLRMKTKQVRELQQSGREQTNLRHHRSTGNANQVCFHDHVVYDPRTLQHVGVLRGWA